MDSPVHIQLQEVSDSEFELAAVLEDGEEAIAEFETYDEEEVEEEEEMYDSEDLDSESSVVFMPVSGRYSVKRGQTSGFKRREPEDQSEDEVETDSEGDEGGTEDEDEEEKQDEAKEKGKTKISPHVVAIISNQTRKRSIDETEGEEDLGQTRVGSPPKRQRKMDVGIEKVSSTASTTGIVSVSVKGRRYYMEEERVQKKRSSEELADDYGDGFDDYIRGGGDTEEGTLKSWKKKRQRIGIENFDVGGGEEVSERRYSRSRSPTYGDDK